ncbi:L-rhamnose mutarotase [Pseudokineococcus sp. 5B2Z-1]|uniref:L-rhamnose mutarotase n=1 Tax=Pseudokineococcus sp. 5B2Z-1 TaxID=3132744 RepID=UPI0030A6DAF2
MIVALHSRLVPGHEEDYDRDHARVPDDLAEAFARHGIRDWRIWRDGLDVFHLVECDDFVAAMTAMGREPANDSWQQVIDRHVEGFSGGDGDFSGWGLRRVFALSAQVG